MTSQGRKRDKNQINICIARNICSSKYTITHTHTLQEKQLPGRTTGEGANAEGWPETGAAANREADGVARGLVEDALVADCASAAKGQLFALSVQGGSQDLEWP
jgi:hypothetical protein